MKSPRSTSINVRIDADLRARIEAHAEATERTSAQVVRLAIREYIEARCADL